MTTVRTGFIGAGFIADTHAAAAREAGATLAAVVDPVAERAQAFARKWGIRGVYGSVDALISAGVADAAHVLVPPPQHRPVAEALLEAGIPVLLEKPMAPSAAECAALEEAARRSGKLLRVNHNAVAQPAHLAARALVAANRIGPVRHVSCRLNMPLRQLAARQFSHWMFQAPLNLLLEQAVHPLSQLDDLVGPVEDCSAMASGALAIGRGCEIFRTWLVSLRGARGTAQLYLSLGESYPSWTLTVIGDDGILHVDCIANRVLVERSGKWLDFADIAANGLRMAARLAWRSAENAVRAAAGTVRLGPRADPFFLSMKESIARFYRDLGAAEGDRTGALGHRMVALAERIAASDGATRSAATARPAPGASPSDVLVIGGTGFIGTHLVRRLVAAGRPVGVLARTVDNLPDLFADPRVSLHRGDARNEADVERAIGSASVVVDLAHGGGGGSRAEIESSLVGSARATALACLARGARLVFVSSIAALQLGRAGEIVTGATPPDPFPDRRADYARAKVLAERALLDLARTRGLAVAILRPGIVVGAGGNPFHSGIGFYNRETHCLGWNRGLNPLPLVLADDVADALARAIEKRAIDGKCYNLVGAIRLSARDYIAALARATHRPLRYQPQSVWKLYAIEMAKSAMKRASGRQEPWASLYDLKSRGLVAQFDCADAMRDLGWTPLDDRTEFLRLALAGHGRTV